MKIVSLVLKTLPQHGSNVIKHIEAVPGASVALNNGEGCLVVLVEDGKHHAVSDSILQIHRVPHVLSVTLSYEYSDEGLALEEA